MASYLNYPSVVERYYKRMYALDVMGKPNEDICLMFHSNRVCVITLAPSHPIVLENKSVKQVDYQITEKVNRLDNKVSGKTKRGGQFLTYESPLCRVTCDDNRMFVIRAGFNGRLLEVNENLHSTPQLLVNKYETNGYIAIAIPTRKNNFVDGREKLLDRKNYLKLRYPDVEIADSENQMIINPLEPINNNEETLSDDESDDKD